MRPLAWKEGAVGVVALGVKGVRLALGAMGVVAGLATGAWERGRCLSIIRGDAWVEGIGAPRADEARQPRNQKLKLSSCPPVA